MWGNGTMTDESLKDFVRAAFNLRDAARYVIDGEAFGHAELVAALAEFAVADTALTVPRRRTRRPDERLKIWPVNKKVGNVKNTGADLALPIEAQW
jgi:hypothetical protein